MSLESKYDGGPCIANKQKRTNESSAVFAAMIRKGFGMALGSL